MTKGVRTTSCNEGFCKSGAVTRWKVSENLQVLCLVASAVKAPPSQSSKNVVGSTNFDDCVYIATATVHRADLLVSWNYKHIVNVYRIRGYNAINMKLSYPILNIHSPKEIVSHEI